MKTNEIINKLENVKGCQFATLTYKSTVSGLKRILGCEPTKICTMGVQFNYSYENAVNNRLEKAGETPDFEAEPLPWGVWQTPNKTIAHKGNVYVRFYTYKNAPHTAQYFVNGLQAEGDTLQVILDKVKKDADKESARQANAGLTDNQVRPFAINADNIISITIDGNTYIAD